MTPNSSRTGPRALVWNRSCAPGILCVLLLALISWATGAQAQSDLTAGKTVSNPTPNVGDQVTFTVTVTNNGPDVATSVSLTDLLPAALAFVSATPSQGTYDAGTGVWTIGTVSPGTPQTLALVATVVSPNAATNTATITNADQSDPNAGNNTASVTVTPQRADLAVAKTVSNPTPNVGEQVTFTVTVSNDGPDGATNVAVTDLLPLGLIFVSATPSQGTYTAGTGSWTIGTISPGSPQTLTLVATVVSPSPATNNASITDANQFDPNTANNTSSATVAPQQQADLAVAKAVSNATPNVGDTVTFTVTVSNNGPSSATSVSLTDLLPAALTFVSATPSQGTYTSGTGVWTIGTISPGVPQTLALVATVVNAPATNTATISTADQFDPNAANNTASAVVTATNAPESVVAVPIDVRSMFALAGLIVLARLWLMRRG